MKTTHKIIKYLAIALAVAIIAGICAGIASIFSGASLGMSFGGTNTSSERIFNGNENSVLYIEIAASKVTIHEGDALVGVTDNEYITVEARGDKLVALERKHSGVHSDDTYLDITVPKDFEFDKVVIKTGAGLVEADVISAKDFEIELGAGELVINNLNVSGEADIEGGAGKITVNSGVINNLDAELGVGKAIISAELTGNSDIEAGVGELRLTLLGNRDSYKIKATTGIGDFRIDGEKFSGGKTVGNGNSVVSVEGGIGSIDISFE